uniref:DNA-directed RNA polymerase I subunit RPA49-like isoform X1 n=2 Tax=Styela clava TaxID=7725 RepID=UPI00193AAD8D|nr:DNA-directed RNA polymerase I subunit RPA49-like isoform X1 [Styela clava]
MCLIYLEQGQFSWNTHLFITCGPALTMTEFLEKTVLPVVEFSHGRVKDGTKVNVTWYTSDEDENKKKMVCDTPDGMQHIGSNFGYNPSRDYLNHYIVLKNKKTGEKKIFLTENYKVYPIVKRDNEIDSDDERRQAIDKVQNETRTFDERLDDLTGEFGSKIKVQAMNARQRNKVSDTTEVVREAVSNLVEAEGISGQSQSENVNLSILPYNKEATSEEDVYPLNNFIPQHIRTAALESAKELLTPTADKIKSWREEKNPLGCRYIAWRARNLHPSIRNDVEAWQDYVCNLQILAYFMKVYNPTGSGPEKLTYLANINETIKSWIIREFMPLEKALTLKKRLAGAVKDKILSYSIVLPWHLNSFSFDIQMLADGFGISERTLSLIVRALGGKIKVDMQEGMKRTIAILQLPLVFPNKPMKGRR